MDASSRRGPRSGLGFVESACAKSVVSLAPVPAGQEREAGSSSGVVAIISGRDGFSLMTGRHGRGRRSRIGGAEGDQAASSFVEAGRAEVSCVEGIGAGASGAPALRPKSELEPARSITTCTLSPI